ncbi:VOC family protein [Yoonia sediminilitoris]|uniref:Catechol 2,3-dioxygenase-like lactoylglutathione lyase family enzyme n=1 Tax=Yoonia sediminilitoris TaxID=1286148 RepID=A0A2T6KI69_9RHOB|nr:VOC family protein [Yoonia sediminilitoris]PUB15413.1 catechol 2,3-dioxygenase-like lactoylglutathione lyase family enzyme [Yoonia sediminilitoris]RCW96023.1 catechol 2,3-dioxygenase-like lactoylglutathione lyase family enzyme [Yoonia sediminilitoris]
MPQLTRLDHLVLTVSDIETTVAFYRDVLGMTLVAFRPGDGSVRWAMTFGDQKINLHPAASPFEPKAECARPGTADLCFLSPAPLGEWQTHLAACHVEIKGGPVPRTGATGPILSIYIRDPDGNLIEISNSA